MHVEKLLKKFGVVSLALLTVASSILAIALSILDRTALDRLELNPNMEGDRHDDWDRHCGTVAIRNFSPIYFSIPLTEFSSEVYTIFCPFKSFNNSFRLSVSGITMTVGMFAVVWTTYRKVSLKQIQAAVNADPFRRFLFFNVFLPFMALLWFAVFILDADAISSSYGMCLDGYRLDLSEDLGHDNNYSGDSVSIFSGYVTDSNVDFIDCHMGRFVYIALSDFAAFLLFAFIGGSMKYLLASPEFSEGSKGSAAPRAKEGAADAVEMSNTGRGGGPAAQVRDVPGEERPLALKPDWL